MYFPYLATKSAELKALKELVENKLIFNNIIPILEPIQITKSIKKITETLNSFIEQNKQIILIYNSELDCLKEIINNKNIIIGYVKNVNSNKELKDLESLKINKSKFLIIDNLNFFLIDEFISINDLKEFIFDNERLLKNNAVKKILFNESIRSSKQEGLFIQHHLNYQKKHYYGFSDYSICGEIQRVENDTKNYKPPNQMNIHLVFFDLEECLKIFHFKSDLEYKNKEQKEKFNNANLKLQQFILDDYKKYNVFMKKTYALNKFEELHNSKKSTNAEFIKKFAIMNNLELISKYMFKEDVLELKELITNQKDGLCEAIELIDNKLLTAFDESSINTRELEEIYYKIYLEDEIGLLINDLDEHKEYSILFKNFLETIELILELYIEAELLYKLIGEESDIYKYVDFKISEIDIHDFPECYCDDLEENIEKVHGQFDIEQLYILAEEKEKLLTKELDKSLNCLEGCLMLLDIFLQNLDHK